MMPDMTLFKMSESERASHDTNIPLIISELILSEKEMYKKQKSGRTHEENPEAGKHGNSVQQPMPYQFPTRFWVGRWRHIRRGIQQTDTRSGR